MTPEVRDRLFGYQNALDDPLTIGICLAVVGIAVLSGMALVLLRATGLVGEQTYADAFGRWRSWGWLSVCILLPILLGAAFTIIAVMLLSLGCYREFARATGVFRHYGISVAVVVGILLVNFAVLDHFDRLFFAAAPFTVALIAIVTVPQDRPHGYIQRVALGSLGFLLFGFSLAYIGNIANSPGYRPILLLIFLAVSLNDIFAYCCGRAMGRRKLLPATSPNKTVGGSLGALGLTTVVVMTGGHFVFEGTPVDRWYLLLLLGVLMSALGQMGDLVLSSIKRDLGLKDLGATIPGHGGLLDRFDSLVLVPPVVYHFLSLHIGPLGGSEPVRILSGG